jgi:hypothetical protein
MSKGSFQSICRPASTNPHSIADCMQSSYRICIVYCLCTYEHSSSDGACSYTDPTASIVPLHPRTCLFDAINNRNRDESESVSANATVLCVYIVGLGVCIRICYSIESKRGKGSGTVKLDEYILGNCRNRILRTAVPSRMDVSWLSTFGAGVGEYLEWSNPDFATAPSDTGVVVINEAFCYISTTTAQPFNKLAHCPDVDHYQRQ